MVKPLEFDAAKLFDVNDLCDHLAAMTEAANKKVEEQISKIVEAEIREWVQYSCLSLRPRESKIFLQLYSVKDNNDIGEDFDLEQIVADYEAEEFSPEQWGLMAKVFIKVARTCFEHSQKEASDE